MKKLVRSARWHSKVSKVHLFIQVPQWVNQCCKFTRSASTGRTDHLRKCLLCCLRFNICNISICSSVLMSSNYKYSCSTSVAIIYCWKSKDSAITPETTQTHSHTPLAAWGIAEQRVPSTQNFECSMTASCTTFIDVTQKHKLGFTHAAVSNSN